MRLNRQTSGIWKFMPFAMLLLLCSASIAGELYFKRHVINAETDYSAAALMDVNHDGHIDIVCGGDWYEGPKWKKHFLAEIPRIGGRPDGYSHLPFDVNRDGWTDLITVNYRSRSIKWMEHPGERLGVWPTHIAVEPGPMETGRLVDIDRDGKLDLLPNGAKFAAWWEFRWNGDGPGEPAWIRHDLPIEAGGHGLGFGDINGDGRGDIVGQNGWLEAPENVRTGQWKWHSDFRLERASIPMLVVDPDEDGDADIVWCSAHGFGVYWLENSVDARGRRQWERHAIDTSWSQGHSPLWYDMDGDGRAELITGKRYMAHGGKDPGEYDPIGIFRYEFNRKTRTWDRSTVSTLGQRVGVGLDPKIADIDNDGDPDLLTSGRSGLYWLENLGPNKVESDSPSVVHPYDHQKLLAVAGNDGAMKPVTEPEAWGVRRMHIVSSIHDAHGHLPNSSARVPLNVTVKATDSNEVFRSREVAYRVDDEQQMSATIFIPKTAELGKSIGLVCMFDETSGVDAKKLTQELVRSGFVCIMLAPNQIAKLANSGHSIIEGVWHAMRAADVLQATEFVHGEKIGFVGNAFHGQLGLYVAAIDQRFIATVTDLSNATSLVALDQSHYSLGELIASVAPRGLSIVRPETSEFATVISHHANLAKPIFQLRQSATNLRISNMTFESSVDDRLSLWKTLMSQFRPQYQFRIPAVRSSN